MRRVPVIGWDAVRVDFFFVQRDCQQGGAPGGPHPVKVRVRRHALAELFLQDGYVALAQWPPSGRFAQLSPPHRTARFSDPTMFLDGVHTKLPRPSQNEMKS